MPVRSVLEDGSYTVAAGDFGFTGRRCPGRAWPTCASTACLRLAKAHLSLNGTAVTAGQVVSAADIAAGRLVYAPALNGNGLNYSAFTFSVQDSSRQL